MPARCSIIRGLNCRRCSMALLAEALAAGYTVDQYRVDAFSGATRRNFTYSQNRVSA
jgi:hypothetical protein